MQVGDGIAVIKVGDTYAVALKPHDSETLNTTTFVTSQDARAKLLVSRINKQIDAFFLMSDGMQHLVIDTRSTQPHVPFFESLNSKLSELSPEECSAWIDSVLASRQVTSRTDDDTSLLIARRAP